METTKLLDQWQAVSVSSLALSVSPEDWLPVPQEQWKAVSVASLTLIVLPGCLALCWQGYASPTLPAETQVYWFQGDGGEIMSMTKEGESGGGTVRMMGWCAVVVEFWRIIPPR